MKALRGKVIDVRLRPSWDPSQGWNEDPEVAFGQLIRYHPRRTRSQGSCDLASHSLRSCELAAGPVPLAVRRPPV